ncbi:MAG: hypothetical protein ACLUO9_05665 [Coprococcus comes]
MNDALNSHLTLEKLLYPTDCTLRRESETMLKALKRFLILLVIFILGVTGTVFLMNNETTDDRSDMNNPTLRKCWWISTEHWRTACMWLPAADGSRFCS